MSQPKVTFIVAASENNAIGKANQIPWHLPNDFKYFKAKTMGHSVVMGRRTYDSIGKPLPGRRNIVISREPTLGVEEIDVANNLQDVLNYCRDEREIFIIGGAEIFKQALPIADEVLLTRVHTNIENADTFFPELPEFDWKLVSQEKKHRDEKHKFDYTFEVYKRK